MASASRIDIPGVEIVYQDNICPPVWLTALLEEILYHFSIDWTASKEWHYINNQYHSVANWNHIKQKCLDYEQEFVEFLLFDVLTHESVIHYLETNIEVDDTIPIHHTWGHESSH